MLTQAPRAFTYDPPTEPRISVLHADADILVLNKPSGLLTVPGNKPHLLDCLETRVRREYPGATTVHRLDKDTSGVIVMALDRAAHAHLGLQFEKRQTSKTYIARLWGEMAENEGVVDLPLAADWPRRPRQTVDHARGRKAITEWRVLERTDGTTRVELTPLTGRAHQLRVHMLTLGHPVLGDNLYAHDAALAAAPRLQLHAAELGFTHPANGRFVRFEAPVPF